MPIQFHIITMKENKKKKRNKRKQARRLTHVRKHTGARACGDGSREGWGGEGVQVHEQV